MAQNPADLVGSLRKSFITGKTKSYKYRVSQLKAIQKLLDDNVDDICMALHKDLHKNKNDTICTTIMMVRNHLAVTLENLKTWMQPEDVMKSWVQAVNTAYVKKEPLGVILIISSWNYPIQLSLIPLIGVIAAGNVAVLKPSPLAPASASLLTNLIPQYLDTSCYAILNGDSDFTTKILSEIRFDHIMFTGSSETGRIVMGAAAKYLTPVTLELGGRNPTVIMEDFDLRIAARRIIWGKFANAGQTCIAPDYVLCPPNLLEPFILQTKAALLEFYGENAKNSDDYGRIINIRHFDRLTGLLKECHVAVGGSYDSADLYIEPTIVTDVKDGDAILKDEIFGPILPIFTAAATVDEMMAYINKGEKPLALYLFTNDKSMQDKFLNETSSGGVCINDVIMQYTYEHLPFGGVGNSGMGRYHGKYSFDQFSHHRACLISPVWTERVVELRNPPYTAKKAGWLTWFLGKKL